jgi:hypothetical protein
MTTKTDLSELLKNLTPEQLQEIAQKAKETKKEKKFSKGFIFKKRANSPEFLIGSLSIKVEEAIPFLSENQKTGWVNLDICKSSEGKFYLSVNDFEPSKEEIKNPFI